MISKKGQAGKPTPPSIGRVCEFLPYPTLLVSRSGRVLEINKKAQRTLGISRPDQNLPNDYIWPKLLRSRYHWQRTLTNFPQSDSWTVALPGHKKSAAIRHYRATLSIAAAQTAYSSLLVSLQDITHEHYLACEAEVAQTTFMSMTCWARTSLDGKYLKLSERGWRWHGFGSEAEALKKINSIRKQYYVNPTDHDRFKKALLKEGKATRFIAQVRRLKTGDKRWVSEDGCLVREPKNGRPLYFESVLTDITDVVETNTQLAKVKQEFADFVNMIPMGYYRSNSDGKIIVINRAAARSAGFDTPEELKDHLNTKGVTQGLYVDPGRRREFVRLIERDGQIANFISKVHPFKSGRGYLWLNESARVVRSDTGKTLYYEGVSHDVTDQIEAQSVLEKAKESAETANKAKSHFFAAASHDLRQPVYALNNLLSVIEMEANLKLKPKLDYAIRAAQNLSDLIEELLNFHVIESGDKPKILTFDLYNLCKKTLHTCQPIATNNGIQLALVGSSTLVESNPMHLERILQNLLQNALHHSKGTKVRVFIINESKLVKLVIRDNGAGIPLHMKDRIFEHFERASGERKDTKTNPGFGLGLAIVNELCSQLGLSAYLDKNYHAGASFCISGLRCQEQNRAKLDAAAMHLNKTKAPKFSERGLAGKNLLVVDDNESALHATRLLLKKAGAKVSTARNSMELKKFLAKNPLTTFDLALIDHNLGENEYGHHVLDLLRKHFGHDLPTLVISGDHPLPSYSVNGKVVPVVKKSIRSTALQQKIINELGLSLSPSRPHRETRRGPPGPRR